MPAPRMRPPLAPLPIQSGLYPRFVAVQLARAPPAPSFVGRQPVGRPDAMDTDQNEMEPGSDEAPLDVDVVSAFYQPWKTRFHDAAKEIAEEESLRWERGLKCGEKVYRTAWTELQDIHDRRMAVITLKCPDNACVRDASAAITKASHEALLLRMIQAFRLAWARILAEPVDPFSPGASVEVSHNWLDEWYNAHEDDPYPTPDDKTRLSEMTGMTGKQIDYWFWNKRKREKKLKAAAKGKPRGKKITPPDSMQLK